MGTFRFVPASTAGSRVLDNLRASLGELRRRKVFRVAAAYAAVAFVVVQAADLSFSTLHVPPWGYTLVVVLAVLGLPLALVLAWSYELTPEGIAARPEAGAAGVAVPAGESGRAARAAPPAEAGGGRPPEARPAAALELPPGPSIAVLPFHDLSGDASQRAFADAMTGDIVTGLTRSSSLFVVSAGDTAVGEAGAAAVAEELGVRYVLEGSVNRSADRLRVTARLTDTRRKVQTWSGRYDRELTSATALFELQDEIREQIVASLGDFHGAIYSEEARRNVHRPTESLSAYECLAVALAYDKYLSEAFHLRARQSLERAVELDPGFDAAWAHLSWIYTDEVAFGYNPLPDSMRRAREAAHRAIQLAPADYHNRWLLSRVHYFGGERDLFLAEAEKSLALNATDGTTIGLIGGYLIAAGEVERGRALVEKARILNPRHPDYYWWFLGLGELLEGDAAEALPLLRKGPLEFAPTLVLLAGAAASAGRDEEALRNWERLERLRPGVTPEGAGALLARMVPYQPELVERVVEALRPVASGG